MALQQKPLGLILQICLLVVLSNPTGVAGWDFSSLTSSLTSSSSRGLRGSQPKEDAFNGFEEDFEIDYNNNNSEDFEEDYNDADVPQEEQRELHAGHYGGHRSYYGGNYRPANAYNYYPNPGSYGGYYNHYGYNNRRYYGAYNYNQGGYYNNQRSYFNRPASYSFYNQGYDDWYQGSRSNFFV